MEMLELIKVDYKFATIGDLRPRRSLKFVGTVYDLAIYNKQLTEAEVQHNWNYAKNAYNITE